MTSDFYTNSSSSDIMYSAMGQIPRSIERISSSVKMSIKTHVSPCLLTLLQQFVKYLACF